MSSFNAGGGFGGALSGAAAGSAFGPVGTVLGSVGGFLTGGFGSSGPAPYEPTKLEEELGENYAFDQVKASEAKRKSIAAQFRNLLKGGNRGAAEAFLESQQNLYTNPNFITKRLTKSYKQPIDYGRGSYKTLADTLYGEQGIGLDEDTYSDFAKRAKGLNIRSPQAFADMIKQDMIASGKVKTPQQEMLSYMFGEPARTSSGRITNLYDRYIPRAERNATASSSIA